MPAKLLNLGGYNTRNTTDSTTGNFLQSSPGVVTSETTPLETDISTLSLRHIPPAPLQLMSDSDSDDNVSPSFPGAAFPQRVNFTLGEMLGLFAVSFSYAFCFNTLNTIVIPKEIERLTTSRQSMWVGLVMATGAVSQLSTPIVGAWSDRAGQRTPYLVYGTFIAILGIVIFVLAESLNDITFLFLAHVTTTVGLSVQYSMVTALLNDYVPEEHSGKGSGAMAILAIVGSGAGYLMFAFNVPLTYSYCSYILASVICLGITVIYIPTGGVAASHSGMGTASSGSAAIILSATAATAVVQEVITTAVSGIEFDEVTKKPIRGNSLTSTGANNCGKCLDSILSPLSIPSPKKYPDFFFACLGRALFNCGLAGQVYLVYYLRDVIGASNPIQITSLVAVMALFGGVVGALPAGMISDKVGKKPVIYGSICLCILTLFCFMTVRDMNMLHAVGFIYGVGNVGYLSVDYALGVQALPKKRGHPIDAAKDLGVFAMSATVGQLFGQVIYGAILDQYGTMTATGTQYAFMGFVAIYGMGAFSFFFSGVFTSFIRNVK